MRRAPLFAIAAQAFFVLAWVIAGALQPGYSWTAQPISELAARGAAHPGIVGTALLVWGAGFVALGWALARTSRAAAALFALAGVLTALEAFLPLHASRSGDQAHEWVAGLSEALLVATPFALAWAWRGTRAGRFALAAGVVVLAAWILVVPSLADGAQRGLWQRLAMLVVHAWVVVLCLRLRGAATTARGATPSRRSRGRPLRPPAASR